MCGGRGPAAARRHGAGPARARARCTSSRPSDCRSAPRAPRRPRRPARRRSPTAPTCSTSSPRCRCSPTATSRRARDELAAAVAAAGGAAPAGRHIVVRAVIETCYLEPAAWRLAARLVASRRLRRRRLRDRPRPRGRDAARRSRRCAPSCPPAASSRRRAASARWPTRSARWTRAPTCWASPIRPPAGRARRGRRRPAAAAGRIARDPRRSRRQIPATLWPAPEWRNW